MTDAGVGQSTCVGIGGDPIIGTTFLDVLQLFAADPETDAIVLIGEIGGAAEETAAAWAAEHLADVPKVAFIAGRTAPEGKRMGHAGAIISGGAGTAASKVEALEAAGFRVAGSPTELPGAPARRRLPRLGGEMQLSDIRFLFAFDRWATSKRPRRRGGHRGGHLVGDEHRRRAWPRRDPGPPPRRVAALAPRPDRRARRGASAGEGATPRPRLAASVVGTRMGRLRRLVRPDGRRLARPGGGGHQPLAGACPRGRTTGRSIARRWRSC